jgi:hypothetical protein
MFFFIRRNACSTCFGAVSLDIVVVLTISYTRPLGALFMRVYAIGSTGDLDSILTTRNGTMLFHVTWAAKAFVALAAVAIFEGQQIGN